MKRIFRAQLILILCGLMTAGRASQGQALDYGYMQHQVRPQSAADAQSVAADAAEANKVADDAAAKDNLLIKCQNAVKTNKDACGDPNSTAGMDSSEQAQLMAGLGMITMIGAQAAAAAGSAKACMLASTLSGTVQALSLLKSHTCASTITSCVNSCNEAQTANEANAKVAATAEGLGLKCAGNNAKVQAMQMQMLMLAMNAKSALGCALASSSSPSGIPATPVALTTAVGDCSDASFAATSTYCICKANPSDKLCNSNLIGGGVGGAVAGGLAAAGVKTPGITPDAGDDGSPVDPKPFQGTGVDGKQTGGGGGGGGGLAGGAGGGLNPEGGGDGTGASGIDKNVITGASTSGGGGLSANGGGGGGGSGGSKSGDGTGGGLGSFNISKYLPKGLFKTRGLAGMTVPAQDGVTGPLGPTIWEKVHGRYEDKKSSLILDK